MSCREIEGRMNWFELTCRRIGLTVHNVVQPLRETKKQVVSRHVEEERIAENVTLRRTTIQEIEVKQPPQPR